MKVLQIIQKAQLRGAELFACQLSEGLNKLGHTAIIVVLFKGDVQLPFTGQIVYMNLSSAKRFIDWAGWKQLASIVEREKPDLIQANAGDTLKYSVLSKLFFRWKKPIIFRNASTVSLYIKSHFVKKFNSFLYAMTYHIISVSEYTRNDFVVTFPAAKDKISVIPVGIKLKNKISVRQQLEGPILLHIGGFTFEKNHLGLIRILKEVLKTFPTARLWLIGDGPLKESIEQYVEENSLSQNVIFYGYQNDPYNFLLQADIFVLPSIIEGLPSVILEAFHCNVPVVSFRVGGIPEIVIPNKTGCLIEKNDERSFAYAVINLLENKAKSKDFQMEAYQMVVEKYDLDKIINRFVFVYQDIISEQ